MTRSDKIFWASFSFALGVAIVINSNLTLVSLIGIVPFGIGYLIAPREDLFWSRIAVTLGLPTLTFGYHLRTLPFGQSAGLFLIILATAMMVFGFWLYVVDKFKSRNKGNKHGVVWRGFAPSNPIFPSSLREFIIY